MELIRHTLETITNCVQSIAEADQRVSALWLFGSYANGQPTPRSDVDLAILSAVELPFWERLELAVQFATALNVDHVDLIDLQHADALLRQRILRGHLIFERDPQQVNNVWEATSNELRHNAYRREQALHDYLQSMRETYV